VAAIDQLTRVASVDDVPDNEFLIVDVENTEIGIARIGGEYVAVRNQCPHHGAPICHGGMILGTMLPSASGEMSYGLDGKVLICPWHHYEFSLESGRPLFTDVQGRVRLYEVVIDDGQVYVNLRKRAQNAREH
jgi:nitrite reductase (NADH) small subunit